MLLNTYSFQETAIVCVCKIIIIEKSQLDLEICVGFPPQPGAEHPHCCSLTASVSWDGGEYKEQK